MNVMTRQVQQIGAMDDCDLEVAAARFAGWQIIKDAKGTHHLLPGESIVQFIHCGEPTRELPKYARDLDAIQKAVDDIIGPKNDAAMQTYIYHLLRSTQGGEGGLDAEKPFDWYDLAACANATARERCVAFVATMVYPESHNYRTCKIDDCRECQELVDHGLVMVCDECSHPGSTASDGWTLLNDGRTLCTVCAPKPGMVCNTLGCSSHPVEDGVGSKAVLCIACRQ